ncbi:quinone oxidureductase [Alcanivorax hongdengensis A-11-3]|uniref:Quinone oxidureductase n=1 Tax=Alcanivorax hongdengensis A-11-3 TaxID=1177179 RepID=L0WFP5_9GAMM|nr:NAD(P)H-quinone oxidoreductase [Alcanivorax hongdengensis]EKF74957.1 quinone oxidureductase [Alcanivorax hongdengensis A-11-3]
MRAWCIENGQLQLDTLPDPSPGPEEILVQVRAIGVNRADLLQVQGRYPAPPGTSSRVPGLEYAGVVTAVGERVQQRRVGDAVMGLVPGCAYAEQIITHEREALIIPDGLDFTRAATLPEAFLTAYRALFLEGGLQAGQWCLIRPATAGVGLAATQLAHALGARPIGSSRDLAKLETANDMGLTAQVREDDTLAEQLQALTDNQGVAVMLDMVGPDWSTLLDGLRPEGTLVMIGMLGGLTTQLNLGTLLMRRQTLKTMTMRSQPLENRIRIAQYFNDRLAPLFASGRLLPLPLERFAFDQAPAAHAHMAADSFSGKRIIEVGEATHR